MVHKLTLLPTLTDFPYGCCVWSYSRHLFPVLWKALRRSEHTVVIYRQGENRRASTHGYFLDQVTTLEGVVDYVSAHIVYTAWTRPVSIGSHVILCLTTVSEIVANEPR